MAFARSSVQMFSLANSKYVLATVTFYTVDVSGNATAVLAPLYAAVLGTAQLPNPQILDSKGKFTVPVYIDAPVIGVVTNGLLAPQSTGIISAFGSNRGLYVTETLYYENDIIQDPVTGNIYNAQATFMSTTVAADVADNNLGLFLSPSLLANGIISSSTTSVTIGSGPQTFTIAAGKAFQNGAWLTFASNANASNYMSGPVTAYNPTTGSVTINVIGVGGSGAHADWNVELAGVIGATGAQGATGLTGVGIQIASATGTSDAITATYSPPTVIADKLLVALIAASANATTTPTFAPDGHAAAVITKRGAVALSPGDIVGAGAVYFMEYQAATTSWELTNPGTIAEVNVSFTDVTTNNASPTAHGYLPKLTNTGAKYLRDDGTYQPITSSAGGARSSLSNSSTLVLTSADLKFQLVSFTAAGLSVQLPDATTMGAAGTGLFKIKNVGLFSFTVIDLAGQPRCILGPQESCGVDLSSIGSASGNWTASATTPGGFASDLFGTNFAKGVQIDTTTTGIPYFTIIPLTNTTFLSSWINSSSVSTVKAAVITIAGETLTVGTPTTIETIANLQCLSGVGISATSVLLHYGTTATTKAMVVSISGTTVTANTSIVVQAVASVQCFSFLISSTAVYVSYQNGTTIRNMVLTISGTTVTTNTAVSGSASVSTSLNVVQLSTTSYFASYGGTTGYLAFQVFTVSGTTVTAGTAITNQNDTIPVFATSCCPLSATLVLCAFMTGNGVAPVLNCMLLSISGTVPTKQMVQYNLPTSTLSTAPSSSQAILLEQFVSPSPNYAVLIGTNTSELGAGGTLNLFYFKLDLQNSNSVFFQGVKSYGQSMGVAYLSPVAVQAGKYAISYVGITGLAAFTQIMNMIY